MDRLQLQLTDREAILVVHALLAANVHSEQMLEKLDRMSEEQFEARVDLRANIFARRVIVDAIDTAIAQRAAA